MLPRALLTAVALIVAASATALIDCAEAAVEILGGDPLGVCGTAASLGLTGDIWVGVGLAVIAALTLAWTWIPWLRPEERRRRLTAERSLERNIGRIPDLGYETQVDGETLSGEHSGSDTSMRSALHRRIEVVETTLNSDVAPREATENWMRLLREVNDLHNSGELSTEDFKEINTRLLDLFAKPGEFIGV
jgi:membrane protein implicated in regulation of membrane protease activity